MATNLRLRPEAEAALRAEAERSGRSQQDILREAVDRHLNLGRPRPAAARGRDSLIASGTVLPPRTPYRKVTPRLALQDGVDSLELLDRDDRL